MDTLHAMLIMCVYYILYVLYVMLYYMPPPKTRFVRRFLSACRTVMATSIYIYIHIYVPRVSRTRRRTLPDCVSAWFFCPPPKACYRAPLTCLLFARAPRTADDDAPSARGTRAAPTPPPRPR